VLVTWSGAGWLASANGERAGPVALACRPATVIARVHDVYYAPLGAVSDQGVCGFCVTGTSAGASQISYALTHYGLAYEVDVAVATSGPPHAAMADGCLGAPGLSYAPDERTTVDLSYGYAAGTGPCSTADAGFASTWVADAVDESGSAYDYPTTRVHFVFGGLDVTSAPAHGRTYEAALVAAGSPFVTEETVPTADHGVPASPDGMAAIVAALLAGP
jgi:hypothetical protein